jgi:hypothetical protein
LPLAASTEVLPATTTLLLPPPSIEDNFLYLKKTIRAYGYLPANSLLPVSVSDLPNQRRYMLAKIHSACLPPENNDAPRDQPLGKLDLPRYGSTNQQEIMLWYSPTIFAAAFNSS